MSNSRHPQAVRSAIFVASLVTAGAAAFAAVLTGITIGVFHAAGTFALLIFLPCFLAFGWLGVLFVVRASTRAHFALATTTALLALSTAIAYGPSWSDRGSCMGGMALFAFMPFSIGFPFVFFICWLLYGINRKS
jgi:hypothetical protein